MKNIKNRALKSKERGLVLIYSLIIMAAMIIAVIALIRSNDTTNNLTTNMILKDSALMSGNNALESAITVLNGLSASDLRTNNVALGYYSTGQTNIDVKTGINWTGSGTGVLAKKLDKDTLGNTSAYVIHRMCETAGAIETSGCVTNLQAGGNENSSKGGSGLTPLSGAVSVYYRITVKVIGPRNTEGYLQAMVYR